MTANLAKLFPFLGIRGKLLVAFVGLALCPVIVLSFYGTRAATDILTQANADHLRLELGSNVGHIESYLAHLDGHTEMLTRWVQEAGDLEGEGLDAAGRVRRRR